MEEETPSTPSPKPSVSSKTHHPLLENPKISTTEFPCAYCHRVFRLKSAQKRHTSIVHEKTEKFYCLSCLKDSYCKPHIMVLDKHFVRRTHKCKHCQTKHVTHIAKQLKEKVKKEKYEAALDAISNYKKITEQMPLPAPPQNRFKPWTHAKAPFRPWDKQNTI